MQIGTFYQTLTFGWGKWEARMYSLKKKKENHKINFIYNFGDTVV